MVVKYGKDAMFSMIMKTSFEYFRSLSYLNSLQRFFGSSSSKKPDYLPPVDNIEKVSDRVYRILGQNPGYHTLQGTNTYLITGLHTNGEHVLLDAGESGAASDKYCSVLFNEVFPVTQTKRLSMILLTHGHFDHVGGVVRILKELKKREMLPLPLIYKRNLINGKYSLANKGFDLINIEDSQIFKIDSETTLHALATPGHTDDHISFLLPEDHAIFTGDCVLGCGTTVFDDLFEYMNSLFKLKNLISESLLDEETAIRQIYPGHGPIIKDGALEKIDEYIIHRMKREKEILSVMKQAEVKYPNQEANQWISSLSMVQLVYGKLPSGVIYSAQSNLLHHLTKLQKEGKVITKFPDLWKLSVENPLIASDIRDDNKKDN
jgi:ribonuclease/clavin/mitogillin